MRAKQSAQIKINVRSTLCVILMLQLVVWQSVNGTHVKVACCNCLGRQSHKILANFRPNHIRSSRIRHSRHMTPAWLITAPGHPLAISRHCSGWNNLEAVVHLKFITLTSLRTWRVTRLLIQLEIYYRHVVSQVVSHSHSLSLFLSLCLGLGSLNNLLPDYVNLTPANWVSRIQFNLLTFQFSPSLFNYA